MELISREEAKEKGLKFYFTGKPCKRGGVGLRYVSNTHCKCDKCLEVYRERSRSSGAEYRKTEKGRESSRKRQARYRKRHKEKTLKALHEWRQSNKEHLEAWRKEYYWKNREYILSKFKEYYDDNIEYHLKRAAERRAKIKQVTPLWYDSDKARELYKLADKLRDATGEDWDVDHIVPIQAKEACGLHWHGNLQVIPATLNRSKGNKLKYTGYLEWLQEYDRPLYSPVSLS